MKKIIFLVALACASTVSAKEQLLVSSGASKSQSAIAIDVMSSGAAVAVQVTGQVEAKYAGVVAFGCGVGAPKTHQVSCAVTKEGRVTMIAFSGSNEFLPTGVVSLGTISVPSAANFKVTEFLASDRNAQPIEVSVVDGAQK